MRIFRTSKNKGYFLCVGLILCLLVLSLFSNPSLSRIAYCASSTKVFIYGFPQSLIMRSYFDVLSQRFGNDSIEIRNLNDTQTRNDFLKIANIMTALGILILPPGTDICVACLLAEGKSVDEIYLAYLSPMVILSREGRVSLIAFGDLRVEDLEGLTLNLNETSFVIVSYGGKYVKTDSKLRSELSSIILRGENQGVEISDVLLPIASLAIVNSVNPCTFTLFTGLLLMVHMTFGVRRRTLYTGLLFCLAIFIGYYALGIGFSSLLRYAQILKLGVAVIGIVMAISSIMLGLSGGGRCPIPGPLKKLLMGNLFEQSYLNEGSAFGLGLIASFTLLPCSSGPYLVGLGLMQALRDPGAIYSILAIYNLIFIVPLVLIAVAIFLFEGALDKVDAFKSTRLNLLELVGGLALGAISVYLLWDMLPK